MANEITTERLLLRQLDLEEARSLATGRPDGLLPSARGYPLEGTLASASMVVRRAEAKVRMGGFGSYQIVRRDDGLVIGDIGFHGPPDSRGAVTIGYGLAPDARGRGYATESLVGLAAWALAQPEVNVVNADANLDNVASQRVMERAGMQLVNETGEKRFYRLP
jgi:RimJ/RimL family protein N-acetyltransferase